MDSKGNCPCGSSRCVVFSVNGIPHLIAKQLPYALLGRVMGVPNDECEILYTQAINECRPFMEWDFEIENYQPELDLCHFWIDSDEMTMGIGIKIGNSDIGVSASLPETLEINPFGDKLVVDGDSNGFLERYQ
tara:strand:- start:36 stop:434 length:399 start_codon:yes stop_codon:yes gene_type:complete